MYKSRGGIIILKIFDLNIESVTDTKRNLSKIIKNLKKWKKGYSSYKLFAEVKNEYKKLDGQEKILINKSLKRIQEQGMNSNQPLRGDLAGCRRLKHRKAGLRAIFRESPDGIEIIQIIAIGKRENNEV